MHLKILCFLVTVVMLLGCGNSTHGLAKVSGVVTLDGKPVPGAIVTFQPRSTGGNSAGPGSTARCDDQGHYSLTTIRDEPGAVVGTHGVTIYPDQKRTVAPGQSADEGGAAIVGSQIPEKYNYRSTLTFEVLSGGTTSADFKLTSKP